MGSEGYLINQFIASYTNKRNDEWGGCYENRIKLALEIVKRCRAEVNPDFMLIFRKNLLLDTDTALFVDISLVHLL